MQHAMPLGGSAAFLFFEVYRNVRIGRKPHAAILDSGNQSEGNEVVVALMGAFTAVRLGQFDPIAFDAIDRADMGAIRADDFGVFLDLRYIYHLVLQGCEGQRWGS